MPSPGLRFGTRLSRITILFRPIGGGVQIIGISFLEPPLYGSYGRSQRFAKMQGPATQPPVPFIHHSTSIHLLQFAPPPPTFVILIANFSHYKQINRSRTDFYLPDLCLVSDPNQNSRQKGKFTGSLHIIVDRTGILFSHAACGVAYEGGILRSRQFVSTSATRDLSQIHGASDRGCLVSSAR